MGKMFVRGRCPVCGWVQSPKQWRRPRGDNSHLGQAVQGLGGRSGFACSPLTRVADLESREPGLLDTIRERLLGAVARWVRWRLIPMRDVLNALPIHYLGAGQWAQEYERMHLSKRPVARAAADMQYVEGKAQLLYQRRVTHITGREGAGYDW